MFSLSTSFTTEHFILTHINSYLRAHASASRIEW